MTRWHKKHEHKHNETRHGEIGAVRQNPIQRTKRTAHLSVLMTVHNFSTQVREKRRDSSDNLPSYLQTITTARMLSIRGEEVQGQWTVTRVIVCCVRPLAYTSIWLWSWRACHRHIHVDNVHLNTVYVSLTVTITVFVYTSTGRDIKKRTLHLSHLSYSSIKRDITCTVHCEA